jgi:RNA polymerase sigma-70 factor (ECF subfamily)
MTAQSNLGAIGLGAVKADNRGEAALVAQARQGEGGAFDQLYQRHRDSIYNLCLNYCGDPEEAGDLLQETFVRAWRGLPKFSGRAAFTTWLYRIAINLCRDAARRKGRAQFPILELPVREPEAMSRVRSTLLGLRPAYRTVLALRYTDSLSYQEIADCLGWSLPRVKVTLHRAKLAFKQAYLHTEGEKNAVQ